MRHAVRIIDRSEFDSDAILEPDDIEVARAQEYALMATLLSRSPDQFLLQRIAELPGDASPIGIAHSALAYAARCASATKLKQEYFDLFVGLGHGELLPYGSYYLTGFLHDRPLARLREDLSKLGIERVTEQTESEDHAAILCEIMAGVVGHRFPTAPGTDRVVFEKHLLPWIGRFFADLEQAHAATFYRTVGRLGRAFIDIETEAFALPS
jgi:TorA maturation chaperone TorD